MAGELSQTLTMVRGADEVYAFDAPAGTEPPAAAEFTCAAANEGEPFTGFPLTIVGGGITVDEAAEDDDGNTVCRLTVTVPRAVTAAVPARENQRWSLWDVDHPDAPLAAGILMVKRTARKLT